MEWPKRARTVDWENGVLILDGEKQFEVPELTAEIMERLAGYTYYKENAKGAFGKLANVTPTDKPDTEEKHSIMHIDHYHVSNKSSGFEVHSFYGMPS